MVESSSRRAMFRQRFFLNTFLASLIFWQLGLWTLFLNWKILPPQVPLYYFRSWGESRLGTREDLLLLPLSAGLVLLFNLWAALYFYQREKEKLLAQLLLLNSVVVNFLAFIYLYRIVNLVSP